jgi:ABC-type phosphate transport system permease subunit
VAVNLFQKKKFLAVTFFVIASRGLLYTNSNLGSPYLFGYLKHDRSLYSVITLIGFPINICCSMLAGYYAKTNPLMKYYRFFWLQLVIDTFLIYGLFANYHTIVDTSRFLFEVLFGL